MGMFDTFHVQDNDRTVCVQTNQFACLLDEYRIGDLVDFEPPQTSGITAYIEDHRQDYRDDNCPIEWIVLLIVDGCFVDSFVAQSQEEAKTAADVMVKLWSTSERQCEFFKQYASIHYKKRLEFNRALDRALRLLRDYAKYEAARNEPEKKTQALWHFMRHDFEKESLDKALAKILIGLPEYKEFIPEVYSAASDSSE
jgi:hypothetical protein